LIKKIIPNFPCQLSFLTYGNYLEYIIYFIITLTLALQLNKLSSYIRTQINQSSSSTAQQK
jgi:hypothetical protein